MKRHKHCLISKIDTISRVTTRKGNRQTCYVQVGKHTRQQTKHSAHNAHGTTEATVLVFITVHA